MSVRNLPVGLFGAVMGLAGIVLLAAFLLVPVSGLPFLPDRPVAHADEKSWRTEFDALCGQSENFMNMTAAELKVALEKCDALKADMEKLEATPRKIYLKRLQQCRNLLAYMLESKLKDEQK